MKSKVVKVLAGSFLAAMIVAPVARADDDRIFLLDGSSIPPDGASWSINVTSEDFKKVVYRQSNAKAVTQQADSAKVLKIVRGDIPKDWTVAVDFRNEGLLPDAAEAFVKASGRSRPYWIKQYGLFEAAECYFLDRDWNNAIQAYENLIAKVPNTRFLPQSLLRMSESYFNAKDIDKAQSGVRRLRSEARAKGFDKRWDNMAKFWEIRCRETKDDWPKVISDYEGLKREVINSAPRIANMCSLRIGYGYIQQGSFTQAREFYGNIAAGASDDEVESLAGAYLGLGNCYLAESGSKAGDKLKNARENYLRVICSYYDDPELSSRVPPAIVAESLFKAGLCFEIQREENHRRRAYSLYQEVVNEFSGTEWADQAKKRSR